MRTPAMAVEAGNQARTDVLSWIVLTIQLFLFSRISFSKSDFEILCTRKNANRCTKCTKSRNKSPRQFVQSASLKKNKKNF